MSAPAHLRVAIVAESFLPHVNGVSNSVLRILEHLRASGHEAIVIAPGAHGRGPNHPEISHYAGFRIVRVPTIRLPFVDSLPIGLPTPTVFRTLKEFAPDIVHLASPFALGRGGGWAARRLKIPRVAVFQTDIAGFAGRYRLGVLQRATWRWICRMHNHCQLTLAPSTETIRQLEAHGVENLARWGRGVDTGLFHPDKRSECLRREWIGQRPQSTTVVGYVGRLAAEKGVHRLATLAGRDDIQLVIVGDGPCRGELEALLPQAVFCGVLTGADLATAYASFDVFVHPGELETFCQTLQEAQASGVPTIAPRAGGPVDLIDDYVNGRLLAPETFADELVDAVAWVVAQSSGTEGEADDSLRGAARAGVEERTWEAVCSQLVDYYRAVLDSSSSTAGGTV